MPELWVAGVPVTPETLPGSGDSPGTMICTREKTPGWTVKGSLVPFFDGWVASYAYTLTLPRLMLVSSARYIVTLPLQAPLLRVTEAGLIRPSPKEVNSLSWTGPVYPVTVFPAGSLAVTVIGMGVFFCEMFEKMK